MKPPRCSKVSESRGRGHGAHRADDALFPACTSGMSEETGPPWAQPGEKTKTQLRGVASLGTTAASGFLPGEQWAREGVHFLRERQGTWLEGERAPRGHPLSLIENPS